MISNWKKPFGLQGFRKKIQRFKGWRIIILGDDEDAGV